MRYSEHLSINAMLCSFISGLKVIGYTFTFYSIIFTNGDNFCDFRCNSLDNIALPKWGLFSKKIVFFLE